MDFAREEPAEQGCWDVWAAEYLGMTLDEYYLEFLWKPLGLIEAHINQDELLRQGALFRAGIHPNQELLKEVIG